MHEQLVCTRWLPQAIVTTRGVTTELPVYPITLPKFCVSLLALFEYVFLDPDIATHHQDFLRTYHTFPVMAATLTPKAFWRAASAARVSPLLSQTRSFASTRIQSKTAIVTGSSRGMYASSTMLSPQVKKINNTTEARLSPSAWHTTAMTSA